MRCLLPHVQRSDNSPPPSTTHTVYIIPRGDRLPQTGGAATITLATPTISSHQLRIEDDDDDVDSNSGEGGCGVGLLGADVVLGDHDEILETEEVLADQDYHDS